jgi:hypothetical protein
MEPQALNVSPASARPAIERAASKRRMGDRGYQKPPEKRWILIRLLSADRRPSVTGYLPQVIGEGSMLGRARVEAVAGQPIVARTGFTADLSDVDIRETRSCGFCPSNRIEGVDSRA